MTHAPIVGERRPLRNPRVWLRQAGAENVVYDPAREAVHVMNTTAVAIWVLCDGETDPSEMIAAVCALSALPYEVVEEDVTRILGEFDDAGVISWTG
ncbi:MAG TPA: PqqD family protein [Actinomycetota bacterium]|nr:PqqD family protein [Actinomycetota bacterium]